MALQTALFSKALRMAVTAGETGEMLEHIATKNGNAQTLKKAVYYFIYPSHVILSEPVSLCVHQRDMKFKFRHTATAKVFNFTERTNSDSDNQIKLPKFSFINIQQTLSTTTYGVSEVCLHMTFRFQTRCSVLMLLIYFRLFTNFRQVQLSATN